MVGLPEVSRLIKSAISMRQEDQRKGFLRKKMENGFTMNTQKYALVIAQF